MRSKAIFFQSMYDGFIANYLMHFPANQLLVLYTETDLAPQNAEKTMKLIQAHLNISDYKMDPSQFGIFNGKGCYGWKTKCEEGEGQWKKKEEELNVEVSEEDMKILRKFFLPSNLHLVTMAMRGLIRPPPQSWFSK